ncbi:cytochrome c oxidase, subunit VIa [Dipodascopsis uninucleata]
MSAILRSLLRPITRPAVRVVGRRNHSRLYVPDEAKGKAFIAEQEAIMHHAAQTSSLWFKVSVFLAAPLVAFSLVRSYKMESEHISHLKHHSHEEEEDEPPELPYKNIRNKDYFWGNGDETAFWNPLVNKHRT